MRLTVRTLLAWLDNVLPAGEQHELGDKVAASTAAQHLVERIRRVVERPTVPAPRLDGKGLANDANSVACYLDNTLEHDRLEEFERVLIESDMHLAEVAACHQLIATFAEDPLASMPLDGDRRARLLAAMQHRLAVRFAAVERQEQVANAQAVGAAILAGDHAGGNGFGGIGSGTVRDEIDTVLVDRRDAAAATTRRSGRSSKAAWASALAAVSLLLLLGGLLVRSINGRRPETVATNRAKANPGDARPPVAASEPENPTEKPALALEPAAIPTEPVSQQPAIDAPAVAVVQPPAVAPMPAAAEPDATQPATPPAAPQPSPDPVEMPRVPQGDALAIAAPIAAVPAAQVPAQPVPAAQAVQGELPSQAESPFNEPTTKSPPGNPAIGFVADNGILLHRVVQPTVAGAAARTAWVPFTAGAVLEPREEVLVPAGAYPEVSVGGVMIRPLPGTRATLTQDSDGTPRIEIAFGRVVARASRGGDHLAVIAGGLSGTIVEGLIKPVAIEVDLERQPGGDPMLDPARVRALISSASGGIVWKQSAVDGELLAGIGPEGMLDARHSILWDDARPKVAAVVRQPSPAWLDTLTQSDRIERGASEALAARLATGTPFDRALREMSADRRAENRMLAVSSLGLLGEYDELVELLASEGAGRKLENRQWLALESSTVPLALARGEISAGRLRETFERVGPPGRGEIVFRMACGFSNDQLASGADAELVAALEDSSLIVRRYAYKCLCDIVRPSAADKVKYRADGLPEHRREGVVWWRSQLEKSAIRRLDGT